MVRVIYRAPLILRFGAAATLAGWTFLFAYLVAFTNPPVLVALLLFIPALLLAWVSSFTSKAVVWEVDERVYRKSMGTRVLDELPLGEIQGLSVDSSPPDRVAILRIKDHAGQERIRIVTGPSLNLDGLRVLYEALAFYCQAHGVRAANPLGWTPLAPVSAGVRTRGEPVRLIPHLSLALVLSGLTVLFTGGVAGTPVSWPYGVALIAVGGGVYARSRTGTARRVGHGTDQVSGSHRGKR